MKYDTPVWEVSGSGSACRVGNGVDDLRSYDIPVWEGRGSGPGCQSGYKIGDLRSSDIPVWKVRGSGGISVVQVLVVRMDLEVVIHVAVTYVEIALFLIQMSLGKLLVIVYTFIIRLSQICGLLLCITNVF